jgi:predicted O-methyltransferase YrrM
LFPLLRPGGMILLDDASRPGERVVAGRWRKDHRNIEFILDTAGAKGTLIGRKQPAA